MRAAVREGLLAEAGMEMVLAGGVRERLIVVAAKGILINGAPVEEVAIGCLRTLTAAEDALTVDCIKLGSTGALGLSTREGSDFGGGGGDGACTVAADGLVAGVLLVLSSANSAAAMFGCWTMTWTSPADICPGVDGSGVCMGKENFSSLGDTMREVAM